MVIHNLPEGTTHITKLKAYMSAGGRLEVVFFAFKYEATTLMVYDSDNDNEYPLWVLATHKFKTNPEVFPI